MWFMLALVHFTQTWCLVTTAIADFDVLIPEGGTDKVSVLSDGHLNRLWVPAVIDDDRHW